MNTKKQTVSNRPEGVPHEITGYQIPLFSMLDDAAEKHPNQTYTIYQGANRTFKQVKDAADKVAGFLNSKGVKKGDHVALFLPQYSPVPGNLLWYIKSRGGLRNVQSSLYR
jgi:long-chain acyl-CoA synthetase